MFSVADLLAVYLVCRILGSSSHLYSMGSLHYHQRSRSIRLIRLGTGSLSSETSQSTWGIGSSGPHLCRRLEFVALFLASISQETWRGLSPIEGSYALAEDERNKSSSLVPNPREPVSRLLSVGVVDLSRIDNYVQETKQMRRTCARFPHSLSVCAWVVFRQIGENSTCRLPLSLSERCTRQHPRQPRLHVCLQRPSP